MREEVAAAGTQQVYFLTDVVFQFVKARFRCAHLGLNLRRSKTKVEHTEPVSRNTFKQ